MISPTPGYQALREGAALLDLTGRGVVRVTGEDRIRLLHAMTTNHIQSLTPGHWRYAFFLNAQGRMLADANIVCTENELLLDVESDSKAFLLDHLDKFIIADDVEVIDITAETAVIALEGPRAEALAVSLSHKAWPISSTGAPAVRFYLSKAVSPALVSVLTAGGAVAATPEDAEAVRLEHARPCYGADLTANHIPHEARLCGAVHFNKGCYLGQEIVERVRSRGRPNRLLTHFEIEGSTPIAHGEKLTADGKEVGEITSSAYSPAEGRMLAFGYVRTEFSDPGKRVMLGNRTATASGRLMEIAAPDA